MRWLLLVALVACDSRKLGVLDREGEDAGADAAPQADAAPRVEAAAPGPVCSEPTDGGFTCSGCAQGEVCFTQTVCGPGDPACGRPNGDATPGDDRCHRSCEGGGSCGAGEECRRVLFFGCGDFNGSPAGKAVCVAR